MAKSKIQIWLGLTAFALVIAFSVGMTASGAFAGAPAGVPSSPGKHVSGPEVTGPASKVQISKPTRPYVNLYDQLDNPGTNSTVSQNFETALNAYDNQLADDFIVPNPDSWTVNEVDIAGVYFNGSPAPGGPARNFHVYFYSDASGIPGTLVADRDLQAYTNTSGVFAITISPAAILVPGHYWVSVQANMDYGAPTAGEFGWTDRTVTSNTAATWQNPGGGFATSCTSWGPRGASCAIDPTAPDQEFRLLGSAGPTPTFTLTPLLSNTPTPTLTPTRTNTPLATPTCLPQLIVFDASKQKPGAPATNTKPIQGEYGFAAMAVKENPGKAEYLAPDASFILAIDDGTFENSIGFGTNGPPASETAAIWLNRFTPGAPLVLPYSLQNISIFWPAQGTSDPNSATFITETAKLLIYFDADGDGNPANAALLYQQDVTVGVTNTFRTYNINPGLAITQTGDIYAGFEDSWAIGGGYQPRLFPASIDTTVPHQLRSWIAAGSGSTPPDINNLGNNGLLATIEGASGGALTGNWGIRLSGDDNRSPHCLPTFTPLVANTPTITRTPTNTATITPTPTNTNTPTITPTAICPGSWTSAAPYPSPALDEAVAVQGGILYSFSGVVGGNTSALSYKYDPTANTWTAIASLPAARENASAVSDGTFVYILNGSNGSLTNTFYKYDPTANTYTTLASPATATWAQTAAYLNGKIYRIGGCSTITGNSCTALTNTVEAYDIAAGTWSTVASYPDQVFFLMSTSLGGFVYAAGGIDIAGAESAKTYKYDPGANTWSDAGIADLPLTRWGAASDVLNGKWILAGGFESTNDDITKGAISWDPGTNTWSGIDLMLQPRARLAGGAIGSAFYAVAGSGDPFSFTGTTDNQKYLFICTPSGIVHGQLTWQSVLAANRPLVTGTLSICVGGTTQNFPFTTDTTGAFTVTTGLADGSYHWRVVGGRHITNSDPADGTMLTFASGSATKNFGTIKGGNTNYLPPPNPPGDNLVNSTDFTALKAQFGQAGQKSADFDYTLVVNGSDFTILKSNFGQAGHAITCP